MHGTSKNIIAYAQKHNINMVPFKKETKLFKDQIGLKVKVHIRERDFSWVTSGSISVQLQVSYGSHAFSRDTTDRNPPQKAKHDWKKKWKHCSRDNQCPSETQKRVVAETTSETELKRTNKCAVVTTNNSFSPSAKHLQTDQLNSHSPWCRNKTNIHFTHLYFVQW